jgi:hypothetical protein
MNDMDRELIRIELEKLQHEGRLNPDNVIEAAKDPNNVLHKRFEWDDSIAAQKYRLEQAEQLIKRVKLNVRYETVRTVIPTYVKDVNSEGPGFISLTHGDFNLADAYSTIDLEIERVCGNYDRGLGVAATLDQKHPGLLDYYKATIFGRIFDGVPPTRRGPSPDRPEEGEGAPSPA